MSPAADLLVVNGRLFQAYSPRDLTPYGSDVGPRPVAAPNALAVVGGRIAWIGRDDEGLRDWRGPATTVHDARFGLITAGFDDAHVHLLDGAAELDHVDLFGLRDVRAIQAAVARHAAENRSDAWVRGRGWTYVAFPGGLPTRDQLDAVVPDRPAFISCYDGHTGWVNTAALRLAGIDRDTPDPPAGMIDRDPRTGEATGVLREAAQSLVERVLPRPSRDDVLAAARRTIAAMHAAGITSVQDAWVEVEDLERWHALFDDGSLRLRARLALPMQPDQSLDAWRSTLGEYDAQVGSLRDADWLRGGILKGFVDGVIEARTAALLAPYANDESSGHPEWAPDQLDAFVAAADAAGWQLELHAIGDGAVRMALDAYERAAAANGSRDRRHRIEHVETVDRADLDRFGALGVVASMQPYHADPSPNQVDLWAGNIGPDRAGRAWAWSSIRRSGGVVAFGSDWPVVPFDPFIALNAAANRQTIDGHPPGGWLPSEKLSLPDALAAYGHGSAYAAHADHRRGTLKVGMDADLVVLDRDILAGGPSSIIGTRVALTVVGGEIVHRLEDIA